MDVRLARRGTRILGTHIDALAWPQVEERILNWGAQALGRYVCVCNVHSLVTARRSPGFRRILAGAHLATPDGVPLVWYLRRHGFPMQSRIDGPALMLRLCGHAAEARLPIYLLGSTEDTLARLTTQLQWWFPGLEIAGSHAPPFRSVHHLEDRGIVARVNRSGARLVFVSLGCPKQERWMWAHAGSVGAVLIGVGAAFDYHAGVLRRAPPWMQVAGLEWLHRLASEPRRLWHRYLVTNSLFLRYLTAELLQRRPPPGGRYSAPPGYLLVRDRRRPLRHAARNTGRQSG